MTKWDLCGDEWEEWEYHGISWEYNQQCFLRRNGSVKNDGFTRKNVKWD